MQPTPKRIIYSLFCSLQSYIKQLQKVIQLQTKVYLIDNQSEHRLTIVGSQKGNTEDVFIPLGPNKCIDLSQSNRYCKTTISQYIHLFINGCYTRKRIQYIHGQATLVIKNTDISSF